MITETKQKVKLFVNNIPKSIGHTIDFHKERVLVYLSNGETVGYWLNDILKSDNCRSL